MEITLQVTGISKFKRKLTDIQTRQLPFATAKALTLTAKAASEAGRKEIPQVFKSPTPYTQNSIAFTPATKQALTAKVFVKDRVSKGGTPPARYLLPEVRGGDRNLKRFEKTLRDTRVLPTGLFAVPGSAASRSVILWRTFRALGEQGHRETIPENASPNWLVAPARRQDLPTSWQATAPLLNTSLRGYTGAARGKLRRL